jgi:hypothetical protein
MKKWLFAVGLVGGSLLLGGTVLREPIAYAAQSLSATIVGPLDANGNVKTHEQGTADVNVTNTDLAVHGAVSVSTPSPISSGAREASADGGVSFKLSGIGTQTASVISVDMTPGATGFELYTDGGGIAAAFEGPGAGGQAHILIPLPRPISFDSIACFGGGNELCHFEWIAG